MQMPNRDIRKITKNWELYLFLLPTLAYFVIFVYIPMYGVQIAFKDFSAINGIWGSPWVGIEHFRSFFNSYYVVDIIRNTVGISLYQLAVGFPFPIILALLMNELKNERFKKFFQTVTYAPHFISTVVMAGMIISFLSPSTGIINFAIKALGGKVVNFMVEPMWFKTIYVFSGVWQNAGWGTIIYLAVLATVDIQLYDSAIIDGATKLQKIWHIDIPSILPTIVILLILSTGHIMSVGFEKVFLLQNPLNLDSSEIISTYVYKSGLLQAQYSFSTAIGLFNSVINFILLVLVSKISKRISEVSFF